MLQQQHQYQYHGSSAWKLLLSVSPTQQEIALHQTVEERPTVGDVLSCLVAVSRRRPQEVPFLALLHDGIPVVSRDLSVQVQGGDTLTCILQDPESQTDRDAMVSSDMNRLDLSTAAHGLSFRLEIQFAPILSTVEVEFPERRAPLDTLLACRPSETTHRMSIITWTDTGGYRSWWLSGEPWFGLPEQGIRPELDESGTRMMVFVEPHVTQEDAPWDPYDLREELLS